MKNANKIFVSNEYIEINGKKYDLEKEDIVNALSDIFITDKEITISFEENINNDVKKTFEEIVDSHKKSIYESNKQTESPDIIEYIES